MHGYLGMVGRRNVEIWFPWVLLWEAVGLNLNTLVHSSWQAGTTRVRSHHGEFRRGLGSQYRRCNRGILGAGSCRSGSHCSGDGDRVAFYLLRLFSSYWMRTGTFLPAACWRAPFISFKPSFRLYSSLPSAADGGRSADSCWRPSFSRLFRLPSRERGRLPDTLGSCLMGCAKILGDSIPGRRPIYAACLRCLVRGKSTIFL